MSCTNVRRYEDRVLIMCRDLYTYIFFIVSFMMGFVRFYGLSSDTRRGRGGKRESQVNTIVARSKPFTCSVYAYPYLHILCVSSVKERKIFV